jgi:apolipoprotein D and lipocalin family protein
MLTVILGLSGTALGQSVDLPPVQTVPRVELSRYLGTWYEIASFPQRFQHGCTATKATYTMREDGEIDVLNECRKDSLDGPLKSATGRARVVDTTTNAKLEVTFFWPFWGDYWILELGSAYEYAVVGDPTREYLWILAREPMMDDALYNDLVGRLQRQRFATERLVPTAQPGR